MVKIKIDSKKLSDVSDMRAKGWHISIFRSDDGDFIIVEKKDVRFKLGIITNDNGEKCVEVTKFLHGVQKDTKLFDENGVGLCGTICISEGKLDEETYAFFRNQKLQDIIEEFSLKRIVFPREAGNTFEKDVYHDYYKSRQSKDMPTFHTDGTYEQVESKIKGIAQWHIVNATYVYEYNSATLTIPQKYDVDKVRTILNEILNNN